MSGRERERSVLLIAGPTASGKSRIALELAERYGGVVINADALQVYRELEILSARPGVEDLARAPHRLYGFVSAAERFSAGRWLEEARSVLEETWARGAMPIVTGGTGLYFKALEGGLADMPSISDKVRVRVAEWMAAEGVEELSRRHMTATGEHFVDRQRLVRALEVHEETGRSLSDWQSADGLNLLEGATVSRVYLLPERDVLYAGTERRLERMVDAGALDEVRRLLSLRLDPDLPAMKAIGVREFGAHLAGDCTLDEALTAAKTQTRRYVKRQLTWYRGQMHDWPVLDPGTTQNEWEVRLGRLMGRSTVLESSETA